MPRCLLVYDITDDRIRTKVASLCQDYGLSRIQYSAFLGQLARVHQEELMQKIRRRLGKSAGQIALFTLCDLDFNSRREIRGA
jgi:CRISPR-associated protein Cas2